MVEDVALTRCYG